MSTREQRTDWISNSPIPDDAEAMSDADKLRTLACWFDVHDREPSQAHWVREAGWTDEDGNIDDTVQKDLWRIAAELDSRMTT